VGASQQVVEKFPLSRHAEQSEGSVLFIFSKVQQMLRFAPHDGWPFSTTCQGAIWTRAIIPRVSFQRFAEGNADLRFPFELFRFIEKRWASLAKRMVGVKQILLHGRGPWV
jgi:hypothetical protein